jgi:arginine-tRNA-protein transferase
VIQTHFPKQLSAERYDQYLASGWFRGALLMYKLDLFCMDEDIWSVVNIRLDLKEYERKKSQRKIIKRVEDRFRVTCDRAVVTAEKERLYDEQKNRFKGFIHDSLDAFLNAAVLESVYNTWEICVYEKDRLIAVSFFDLGDKSMASLLGLFDSGYDRFSLGTYTMLKEVAFGKRTGRRWFYPGYVLDRPSPFDYKLKLGPMYYYTPGKRWGRYTGFDSRQTLAWRIRKSMHALEERLENEGIISERMFYPYFTLGFLGLWEGRFLRLPMLLKLGYDVDGLLVLGMDPETETLELIYIHPCTDENHFIGREHINEFKNSDAYLSQLMEVGDRNRIDEGLDPLIEALQAWTGRSDVYLENKGE